MWFPIVGGTVLFILLSIWIIPYFAVYQMTRMKGSTYEQCLDLLEHHKVFTKKQYDDCDKEELFIRSHDGLSLHGYYIESFPASRRVIIIVHGYTSALAWSAQFMAMFFKLGFNVLLVDQRRHGQSEGKYTTFGFNEKNDMQAWVDWVIARKGEDCAIGLHGQSLGGGTVLEYAAIHRPQVRFIIADCPYSDLTELIYHQVTKLNHMPAWPIMPLINRLLKRKAGFMLDDVSPIRVMRTCKLPVLFIHGSKDIFVPTRMSLDMYNAKPEPKAFVLVEGATHGVSYCINKEQYEAKVTDFVLQVAGTPHPEELEQPVTARMPVSDTPPEQFVPDEGGSILQGAT
ncbi:alpha/beta hydrolase [Paenibacillus apiarius]|uniref:alpha/beta hydrolase n=1 Tax=Paenibacillus apiarius TaxID=46240 RepID=UPI001981845E|nr:alpha/beta hydrolase [Paenibacillus apiarius]MBN3524738.1 alpha/beta hydrolase [Paenibacillus apiarius]